jgi:hypothetical protein
MTPSAEAGRLKERHTGALRTYDSTWSAAMKCPFCNSALESGRVSVERKFPARPALATELEFASDNGSSVVPKLGDVALHCPKCDTLILRGAFAEALECFECGATIPDNADACASCGWSWKKNRPAGGYRDPA